MRHRAAMAGILLILGLAGCAAAGGDDGVAPEVAFTYRVPASGPVTYLRSDTLGLDLETPMGAMGVEVTTDATLDVVFTPTPDGLEVSMTFQEFSARVPDPMGGTTTVGGEGIDGPLVFRMNPRGGDVEITSRPGLSTEAQEVVSSLSIAHEFLPILPGSAPAVGSSWVDTVSYTGSEGEQDVESTTVTTYTLVGDTVVGGRTVQRIDASGTEEFSVTGQMQGMDFAQSFSGTREGFILWDASEGVMVVTEFRRELEGSMDMPGAGVPPMGLTAAGVTRTELQ